MSKRVTTIVSGTLLAVFSVGAQPAAQQVDSKPKTGTIGLYRNQQLAPSGPAPKFADGTPDLSGVWLGSGGNSADIANPKGLKSGD